MQEQELRDAVKTGDLKKLRILCEQGALEAVETGWPDARSYLMLSAIKPRTDFTSGTLKAYATGHTEIVAYLLQRGANANYVEDDDSAAAPPLHWAATYGYEDIAALLIQNGADVNATDNVSASTPLARALSTYTEDDPVPDEATKQRLSDTIKLLIDKGANLNAGDEDGETVLHRFNPPDELINYLIDKGANVNAKDNSGMTPLHSAAMVGRLAAAKLLLQRGADVNAQMSGGFTPLDIAQSPSSTFSTKDQMIALLQSAKPKASVPTPVSEATTKGGGCMGILAIVTALVMVFIAVIKS